MKGANPLCQIIQVQPSDPARQDAPPAGVWKAKRAAEHMTLYELREDYKQLLLMLEDGDIDQEVVADTLEALTGDIEEKAEGYCIIAEQLKSDVARLMAEEERLAKRRKGIESHLDALKANLMKTMQTMGQNVLKTEHYTVGIRRNRPTVVIDDPFGVPEDYYDPQPAKLDKRKLLADIMTKKLAGEDLPRYAHLEQSESLSIR